MHYILPGFLTFSCLLFSLRSLSFSLSFLQYTDEEAERCYEEFYEDVHTEFLKYGELINFKVVNSFLLPHFRFLSSLYVPISAFIYY